MYEQLCRLCATVTSEKKEEVKNDSCYVLTFWEAANVFSLSFFYLFSCFYLHIVHFIQTPKNPIPFYSNVQMEK